MYSRDHIDFLEKIDALQLIEKISKFRSLNIALMTPSAIRDAIYDVLTYEGKFIYFTNLNSYKKGTLFYRARILDSSLLPNENLLYESHFWNAPPEYIKTYGRLNKPSESLLYTTPMIPEITLMETKIPDNSNYALMVYEAMDDIKVNLIGQKYDYEMVGIFNEKVKLINNIYNDFLKDEFSRDIGVGTEYLYMVSELITKDFFDLPPRDVQDAWAYPSLKDKEKYNVCFRPDIAKQVLKLKGTMICEKLPQSYEINVKFIQSGFDKLGKAKFYKLGSKEQLKVFPEIKIHNK
ncbi:hypothetical protein HNQ44_001921 [Planomicrobium koreense]|uniref:RES domain-containing protein n=1 Tax=Planococcus koreensis TaxID=112331 RepID=A0A7W8CRX0_9BACL|nr:hypothetical protein [Planococcus koreensis]MBB5180493.1 hypothetical protein [Planococcus koreensis]